MAKHSPCIVYTSKHVYSYTIVRIIRTEYHEALNTSWMKHTFAVRRSDILPVRTFGFCERGVLVPQAVGRLAVLIQ